VSDPRLLEAEAALAYEIAEAERDRVQDARDRLVAVREQIAAEQRTQADVDSEAAAKVKAYVRQRDDLRQQLVAVVRRLDATHAAWKDQRQATDRTEGRVRPAPDLAKVEARRTTHVLRELRARLGRRV
jgi:small-conductance mechanosensitive channel